MFEPIPSLEALAAVFAAETAKLRADRETERDISASLARALEAAEKARAEAEAAVISQREEREKYIGQLEQRIVDAQNALAEVTVLQRTTEENLEAAKLRADYESRALAVSAEALESLRACVRAELGPPLSRQEIDVAGMGAEEIVRRAAHACDVQHNAPAAAIAKERDELRRLLNRTAGNA